MVNFKETSIEGEDMGFNGLRREEPITIILFKDINPISFTLT